MNRITSCPAPDRLKQILQDELAEKEERELSQHLAGCANCQQALDRLVIGDQLGADRLRRFSRDRATAEAALDQAMAELKAAGWGDEEEDMNRSDPQISLNFLQAAERPGALGQLGYYEVLQVVGRGGMGIVLKAFDTSLRRVVAIKVLARHLADKPAARKRFVREARAAAAVSHDHIVTIHAVEAANDPPFLVMQFVDGKSLQQRIDQTGPMELKEILRIGMQTATGLAAAHAQGLVHRDIKPANILLENGVERVKITDFGLARAVDDASVTESGVVAGTPQFMAPEQAAGEAIDHRADLFSLGSVLYAMCTGRPPFRASTTMGVIKRVCEETPRPIRELNPDIPDWLAEIIDKLHAKKPADRIQSAAEVAELLGRRLAELQHARPLECGDSIPLPESATISHSTGPPIARAEPPLTSGQRPTASPRRPPQAAWPRRFGFAAAVLAALVCGVAVTEATGITQVVQSVIRITRGDGTLVIETDDPEVKVTIDGQDIVITGAGHQEIRLRTGKHLLLATKDGQPIREEPITITRGGRQVVSIRREQGLKLGEPAGVTEQYRKAERASVAGAQKPSRPVGKITSLAFSPDGKTLAAGGLDRYVTLWEVASGKKTDVQLEHSGEVTSVAFSSDGKLACCGGPSFFAADAPGEIRLWDLTAPDRPMRSLRGHSTRVWDVEFSPDGKLLASASHDKTVKLWDVEAGQELRTLVGQTDLVWCVAFSPDGRTLASGGGDRNVRLWDVATGVQIGTLRGHADTVLAMAYSPDGKRLASGSADRGIRVWDAETRQTLATFQVHSNMVRSVAFSPDGAILASASGNPSDPADRSGEVIVWDVAPGVQLAAMKFGRWSVAGSDAVADAAGELPRQEGHRLAVWAVAFSPDGKTLATGSSDTTVKFWDVSALRSRAASAKKVSIDGPDRASDSAVLAPSLEHTKPASTNPNIVKLRSPRLAVVKGVFVKDGDFVKQGQPIVTLGPIGPPASTGVAETKPEEIEIRAPCDATVLKVYDKTGDTIDQGHVIAELQAVETPPREKTSTAPHDDTKSPTTRTIHVRLRAESDGSLTAMSAGDRQLKHNGELVGELAKARLESGLGTDIEVIITADSKLKPELLQSVQDAVARAGIKSITVETVSDSAPRGDVAPGRRGSS